MSNIFHHQVRRTGGQISVDIGSGAVVSPVKCQHLICGQDGRIAASLGAINHHGAGLPFDVDGRLCVEDAPSNHVDQGIAFTASGKVKISSLGSIGDPVDYYDQGLAWQTN